ncbi:hypothetical protein [Paenibacillus glacialis]|uniref:Uncharacterized protein n=1 Tax=Paenibacillus glacialis TaxID=494026 RepID=A0A168DF29_9BACL|nr:hypothetical protein [Paenibacillus glacialis]OAB34138.1 hypothetical protein PGLA_24905 [Paenibacillus glacialis]
MKIGGSLGQISNKLKSETKNLENKGKKIWNQTLDDIEAILGHTSNCHASMDQIRIIAMKRYLEYQTTSLRVMWNSNYITKEVVNEVWKIVSPRLKKGADPKIFYLKNYNRLESAIEIDPNNFEFADQKHPCLFVHGMDYESGINSAYNFFKDFNGRVSLFNHPKYQNHELYLVSYDSKITDEYETIIKAAFESLIGVSQDGDSGPLIQAVLWRELEDRARETGDYIVPFLRKLSEHNKQTNNKGFALSHSLGCFTLASAGQIFIEEDSSTQLFALWLCMAAALPANAFSSSGDFELAPFIAGPTDDKVKYGTSVWYSRLDYVLNIAYTLATGHLAMGVTGPLEISRNHVYPTDVTDIVGEQHNTHYFPRLKNTLRNMFEI